MLNLFVTEEKTDEGELYLLVEGADQDGNICLIIQVAKISIDPFVIRKIIEAKGEDNADKES